MVHPAYRYLERATRVCGLTWHQWLLLTGSLLATYLVARLLPLPSPYGLSVALTVCGTPAAGALALATTDHTIAIGPRVLWRWQQSRRLLAQGVDEPTRGYLVNR